MVGWLEDDRWVEEGKLHSSKTSLCWLFQRIPHVHSVNNHLGKMYRILCIWAPSSTGISFLPSCLYGWLSKGQSWWLLFHTWLCGFLSSMLSTSTVFVCSSHFAKKFLIVIIVLTKHFPQCDSKFIIWESDSNYHLNAGPFVLSLGGLTPQHATNTSVQMWLALSNLRIWSGQSCHQDRSQRH